MIIVIFGTFRKRKKSKNHEGMWVFVHQKIEVILKLSNFNNPITFAAAKVVIIWDLALATEPALPVSEMNSLSEGVCWRNNMGTPLISHCLMKWAPLIAAGAFNSP